MTKVYSQTLHGDKFAHSSMSLNLNFVFHLPSNHFTKLNNESRGLFQKVVMRLGYKESLFFLVMQNELENIFTNIYKFPPNLFYKTCSPHTSFQGFFFLLFPRHLFFSLYIYFFSFLFLFFFSQGCPRIFNHTRNTWFFCLRQQNDTSFAYPSFPLNI